MQHLAVFDFDGTLFRSPEPPNWWTMGYWWGNDLSLNPPCVPQLPDDSWWIGGTVEAARTAISSPNTITLCMTGRGRHQANFIDRIPELLAQCNLNFNSVRLSPARRSQVWPLNNVMEWKLSQILAACRAIPTIGSIEIWDDRENHLDFFTSSLTQRGCLVYDHLVTEPAKPCEAQPRRAFSINAMNREEKAQQVLEELKEELDKLVAESMESARRSKEMRERLHELAGSIGTQWNALQELRKEIIELSPRAASLRLAQDPEDEDPELLDEEEEEADMVVELEESPGANWEELYLQPIIRAVRNRFDLEPGQVKLVSPRKKVPFGSDTYGFDIVGHVRFDNFEPDYDEFGGAPYRFRAHISVDGELQLPVEVKGG